MQQGRLEKLNSQAGTLEQNNVEENTEEIKKKIKSGNNNLTLSDKKEFRKFSKEDVDGESTTNKPKNNIKDLKVGKGIELIGEDDHIKEHKVNVNKLISDIKSDKIDKNQAILLERKQTGDNFAMKDVVMLASVLEYNEKHPSNQLIIPENIKQSNILADALLYKTAKEYGIEVVGMEGKLLYTNKVQEVEHNQQREASMVDFIKTVAENKKVVAVVGSAHIEALQSELTNIKPESIQEPESKSLETKVREEVINSLKNTKDNYRLPDIHKELLKANQGKIEKEVLMKLAGKAYSQIKSDIESVSAENSKVRNHERMLKKENSINHQKHTEDLVHNMILNLQKTSTKPANSLKTPSYTIQKNKLSKNNTAFAR